MCPRLKKIQLPTSTKSTNTVTQAIIQVETLCLLRDIQYDTRSRSSDSSKRGEGGGGNIRNVGNNGGSNGTCRRNQNYPNKTTFERHIKKKYCCTYEDVHTHPRSVHVKKGHKTDATFSVKMGGSNAFCK